MHIAFITPEFPHSSFKSIVGGIGTFTKNLTEALLANGNEISIFIYSQKESEIYREKNISIHYVKKKTVKGFTWLFNRKYFNKYVNNAIVNEGIDVIEAPEWTGFTAFMKFKCPLIIRLHGSDTYFCYLENRKLKIKNKFFEKRALLAADKVIGVSEYVSSKTKELFNLRIEINTIHNAVDPVSFEPNHANIEPETLLYFGTMIRKKGVLELPEVFSKVLEKRPKAKLILLGRDNKDYATGKSTLFVFKELLNDEAQKRITYINAVSYDKVKEYICKAEVVLLPSFAEAFPMTWLEAMAMEKKLVTSNIGWAHELMLHNITGYTVNPSNHSEFADCIINLLENKQKGIEMAKNARKRIINNFNNKQSIKENIFLYNTLSKKDAIR